ncbi:MAG: outer membrane protein assembly factor BamD [Sinomicrobium sp.]|nr:outer membrane protein assembly factor BamD [Sinomicrobium sp.]
MIRFIVYTIAAAFVLSCSEYQDALKSEDVKVKYDLAEKLYNGGDYKRANRLFEQIMPNYIGKPQGERIAFFYADSYYKTKDYYLASYQFERFYKSYPKSEKAEEAAFLEAKSYYHISPKYSVDQSDTHKAIEKLQVFINAYAGSTYLPEANTMVKEMRNKLEKKAFEIARQYNTLQDYKSAIEALDNFVSDYPGTPYREEALFYKLDSAYRLAVNSVFAKQEERLVDARSAYDTFKKYYPQSGYMDQANAMQASIEDELKKLHTLN